MIATISDGLCALLVTGGFFALVTLVLTIRALQPARVRSWRGHRRIKRRVLLELERRQEEQLARMQEATGTTQHEAFLRYLELQNSIEFAKRI